MDNNDTTAVPTHYYRQIGNLIIQTPICRCYTTEPNTAGTIYCPLHGEMWKQNVIIKPVNKWSESREDAHQ